MAIDDKQNIYQMYSYLVDAYADLDDKRRQAVLELDTLRRDAQALYNDLYDMSMDATHIDVCDRLRATYPHLEAQREATR